MPVKILEEIRDAVRETTSAVHQTNQRIDQTNARLDQTNVRLESLENRTTEVEIRLSTSIREVAGSLGQLTDLFVDRLDLKQRVEKCEQAIDELRARSAR